jgi:hypothetical protein
MLLKKWLLPETKFEWFVGFPLAALIAFYASFYVMASLATERLLNPIQVAMVMPYFPWWWFAKMLWACWTGQPCPELALPPNP